MKTGEIEFTKQTATLPTVLLDQALAKGRQSIPRLTSFGACVMAAFHEWVSKPGRDHDTTHLSATPTKGFASVPLSEQKTAYGKNHQWHEKLEEILSSGDPGPITAVQTNIDQFLRIVKGLRPAPASRMRGR